MNRLAAVGRIAVCLVFSIGLSAQTPTITVTPTGTAGVYTLAGQYTALAQVHPPTGNVTFEDTTYSNAVLGSAPFSSSLTSSIVQNGSQSFTSSSGYASNVLARDFDGDGKADLLFVDSNYYLTFFKGNGDGTFQAGIADSSVTMQTTLLAVGDWNGDGKLDIAASSGALTDTSPGPANATILIRRGNGDGTFQAPTQFTETIPQYAHQISLQSGDFNGDGKLDLFSTGYYPSHLYLGNGDGTFAAAVVNTIAAIGPVADFNNDGRADIYGDNFTLLGLSNGTLQTVNHTSGPTGTQVAVADFNHDGKLDVAGFSGGNAMVSLGNGDGTFQAVSTYTIDPGPGPLNWYGNTYQFTYSSIASGDFNGDGVPDLAFLGNYPIQNPYSPFSILTVLFGRSDGSFSSPQTFTDISFIAYYPHPFLSVDLAGSGVDTLLEFYPGADDSTQFAGVRRYTAANTFTATATNVIVSPGGTHQVRAHYAGDANYGAAISTTQAITGSTSQATLSLAISPNPSTYGARVDMTVTVTPCTVGSYSCDSDWVDIYDGSTAVTSGYPSGGVAHVIWRNFSQGTHLVTARIHGNTNLSSATSNAVTLTVGPPLGIVSTLTLGNPQQVGSTYTLSAQLSTPAQEVAPTGSVSFVDLTANNNSLATATFGPPAPVLTFATSTGMPHLPYYSLYAADFDNDGKADLIYPVGGNSVTFLHGNGDGTFSGTPTADGFSGPQSFAVADFNHDGKLDVVLTGTSGTLLLRGNGDGTFATATTIASGNTSYSSVFAGDFNGDGKQDIYNGETLFLGNGDGTFQMVVATGVSGQLAADFNQDGRTDLFAYGTLYLGQADGTFTAVPAPTYYASLVTDFNHDGKPDLLTSGANGTINAVVLGNGDGTFQAPIAVDLDPGMQGYSYTGSGNYFTGDFNGDGKADLGAVTLYPSTFYHTSGQYLVCVTFGDGTGAFTNKTTIHGFLNDSSSPPLAVPAYLPDFNGDATSDIPVYTQAYLGTPTGGIGITLYTTPTVYTAAATGITVNGPPYGYHTIQATYPGDANYLDETSNTATIIAPIPVTVMLAVNRNPINTGQQVTFTATLSPFSEGNQTATGTINFSEGSTVLGTGTLNNGVAQFTTSSLSAGSHSIVAQFPGSGFFGQASSTPLSMQVGPTAVNITWPPPAAITYGTALSSTQLNASTAIAGSFAYSPVAGTVLTPGTQTLSATFTPTDTVTYSTTNATVTVVVNKATPTIAVTQTSPATTGTNVGTATTLLATLSAGYGTATGTVTFYDGSTSIGTGTLSGNTVSITTTFTTAGTHAITAVYSGNTNFNTVTSASFSEVVSKLTPTITWPTPAAITYGTPLSATQLNATSSVAGAFVYSPAAGVVLAGGSQTLSVTFIPTDTTTYSNATATVTLVVNKATPSITWATPAAITYGTALSTTQLNATSTVAGIFVYSPSASTVLGVGSQTLSVTFTPTDSTSYNSATATTTLVVNKTTPSITWATPAAITYGTALSTTQLNATSSVAGTSVYSPAAGTVPAVGTQTLSVTFTPTDATSYNSATATTTLVVNKTTPSISWATPAAITYGTALSAAQLNATSSVAGSFIYSPAAGTIPGAGSQALSTTFTPTDTADYSSATGSTTLVVNKATPSITVTQTSPITIGVGTGVATTFRAALAATYGTPTGTVGFYEGTTLLGSAPLISSAASVTTTFSTTGVHTITALYTGDANFNTVTSAAFNETVVLFGIGLAANPTTLTIKQGQSGTATITATPTGNYTGTLTFSCGSLPSSISCSFAPATLTFNGDNQPQATTITVSTRTSSAALMSTSNMRLASILALPLLAFGLRRRRMLQRGLLALFAAMLLLPTSGCGGNSTTTSNPPATGQQTVTINAQTTANGGSTQSLNFSIVIEP